MSARRALAPALLMSALALSMSSCSLFFTAPAEEVFKPPIPVEMILGAWQEGSSEGFVAYLGADMFQAVRFDWATGEPSAAVIAACVPSYEGYKRFDVPFYSSHVLNTDTGYWEYNGASEGLYAGAYSYDGDSLTRLSLGPSWIDASRTQLDGLFGEDSWEYTRRLSTSVPLLRTTISASVGELVSLQPQYVQGGDDIATVSWTIMNAPTGSSATVVDSGAADTMTPDLAGAYLLRFTGDGGTYFTPPGFITLDVE